MGMAEQEKINRMQKNLSVIRNVARWTTERLGEEIGVSRQTINSLEHNKTKMTKTQYLALRAVFNHEATNVLADRKMAAAIAEALPTAMAAAMPPLTSLVVLPIVKQMMKRGR